MLELELSSCEVSEYYYVDYFLKMSREEKNCQYIKLDVDRGVDMGCLMYFLEDFPNLTTLHLEQNYSHPENTIEDFLLLIKNLKLKSLILVDEQSQFLKGLTLDLLVNHVLPDQIIHITYGDDDQCVNNKNITMVGIF